MSRTDHWDSLAPRYDDAAAWVERRFLARGRHWVVPRAHGRVLEVGVGTGANLALYAADVRLTGIDASGPMLDQARRKVTSAACTVECLQVGDAGALDFEDGTFDAVVSTFVLCCVPSLEAALAEAVRVLRPGGDLLLADHVVSTSAPVRWGQRLLEAVTARSADEHFTRRPLDHLSTLPLQVVATQRHTAGALEAVHARRTGP